MTEPVTIMGTANPGVWRPDFVYGADNIAQFLGITTRKVYYFMERQKVGKSAIPIKNLPSIGLCASRQALVDYLNGQRQV